MKMCIRDSLKNHGSDIRYHHDEIGYNMRLEGIQGAVLSVSLKYLDAWTAKRRTIGKRYDREIINPYITLQRHPDNTETVYHLYVVTVPDRDAFLRHMDSKGIMCDMHYPIPCHLQKAYSFLNYKRGDCPNAEYLAEHCCSLPMFPELREDEIERVIEACNSFRTVSYTHLDVYKRQSLHSSSGGTGIMEWHCNFLQYLLSIYLALICLSVKH